MKKNESCKERFFRVRYSKYPELDLNLSYEEIEKEFQSLHERDFPTYEI